MEDEPKEPETPPCTKEEAEEFRKRFGKALYDAMLESFLWDPSTYDPFMEWEMEEDPEEPKPSASEKPVPDEGFPYRAMTEAEVRTLAEGIGRMITLARIAKEQAFAARNPKLELHYRVQAEASGRALELLKNILTGKGSVRDRRPG